MAPELSECHRCICPDLPLGAHRERISPDTDMSLPGLARILAGFLEALDLNDVTIVANDTGGAISQWLVGHHGERVARLVLTSCDAFDKYPPDPQRILAAMARPRPLFWVLAKAMRFRWAQRLSIAYGDTTKEPIDRCDGRPTPAMDDARTRRPRGCCSRCTTITCSGGEGVARSTARLGRAGADGIEFEPSSAVLARSAAGRYA